MENLQGSGFRANSMVLFVGYKQHTTTIQSYLLLLLEVFLLFIASATAVLPPFVLLVPLNTVGCSSNNVSVRNFTVNYLYHYKSID